MDGEPATTSTIPDVRRTRRCRPSRCASCSAGAPGQADRYFAATEAGLKRYGEWFGAYPYGHSDDRRPGLPEPGRRHGVPDVLHRPRPLAAVCDAPDARDDGRSEAGHQWWYGMVASNEFEHARWTRGSTPTRRRASWRRRFPTIAGSCATSEGSCPGRFPMRRTRASTTTGSPATATTPKRTSRPRPH